MKEITKGGFSNISELTTAETLKVSGGTAKVSGGVATYSSFLATPLQESVDKSITFKGSTVFSNGGTYDHDEGVCIQDS